MYLFGSFFSLYFSLFFLSLLFTFNGGSLLVQVKQIGIFYRVFITTGEGEGMYKGRERGNSKLQGGK